MAERDRVRRPRRRGVRAVLVVCGVLLLLWGADTVARTAAESLAARRVEGAGVGSRPDVQIRGPLFLPQLVAGRYGRVEVDADGVTTQGPRLSEVRADLVDVRVPFRELAGGDVERVLVDRTTAEALIRYDDLNRYLEEVDQPFTVSAGTAGGAQVEGTVTVAGQPIQVSGDVVFAVEDGAVRISPRDDGTGTGSPSAGTPFALTLPLGDLPYGQQIEDVRAGPAGLQVEATGSQVVLER